MTLTPTTTAQAVPSAARQRFLRLLREDILQVDAADLDFGIYRILNHRRSQIEHFLTEGLPATIHTALADLPGSATEDEQARIYNALYTFFARYYDDGDFLPRARRGKAGAYTVPYDGSDTFFHWATKGSHYAKSGERFASYAYTQPDGQRVRLAVAQADVVHDNAKGAKRWYLPVAITATGAESTSTWQVAFAHRTLTEDEAKRYGAVKAKPTKTGTKAADAAAAADTLDLGDADNTVDADTDAGNPTDPSLAGKDVQARILGAWLANTAALPPGLCATTLARHAQRYVRGQSTDFFIHPQLGRFLHAELDDYLKTEFLNLWDLKAVDLGRERGKLAVCRTLGQALIDVLASLEEVQARLFEKRKFVMLAHYLVQCAWLATQGSGGEGAALVARAATHPAQVLRWRQWVGVPADEPGLDGPALLARYPHLPLDTALLGDAFAHAVLACVPDVQAATGGVLVHGDNYAALRTLEPQYRQAVKCIYIDPPYNTDASPIDYKNGFREASWLSLMEERLLAAKRYLSNDGVLAVAIDDAEGSELRLLLSQTFDDNILGTVPVRSNPSGRPTKRGFSVAHEYVHFVGRSEESSIGRMNPTEDQAARFNESDATGPFEWRNLRREGSNSDRDARRALHYPIYVSSIGLRVPQMTWDEDTEEWLLDEKPKKGEAIVYPIDDHGNEKTWRWGDKKVSASGGEVAVRNDRSGKAYPYCKRRPNEEGVVAVTAWFGAQYSATEHGTALLKKLFGKSPFKYPKSLFAVMDSVYVSGASEPKTTTLDYFAGSGTTAHAVINLNRDDGGQRKFVLVEQGEYFDTVTLPRVAKVMTSPEWKDGQPKAGVVHDAATSDEPDAHWSRRTLPIVQVLRLERYEDSLDALALPAQADALLAGQAQLAGLDTLLRYLADTTAHDNPVRLSTAALASPFDYRLPTVWEGRAVERPVDLLHTALVLLGLHLVRLRRLQRTASATAPLACPADTSTVLLAEVRAHRPGVPDSTVPLDLLVLRDHDTNHLDVAQIGAAAQAEYDWLQQAVQQQLGRNLASYGRVLHNRDLALTGEGEQPESIDTALAQAMWVRDPSFTAPGA